MYLTPSAVLTAITVLRGRVHPFVGITFLACKHYDLPIGTSENVSIDTLTSAHMDEHHRLDRRSSHYFQPFYGSSKYWVADRYPSTGLQTINTQTFSSVFLHPRGKAEWGFQPLYLERMRSLLSERRIHPRVPADALALWLFKNDDIGEIDTIEGLVRLFFERYNITESESKLLFADRSLPGLVNERDVFSSEPLEMTEVLKGLPVPPDAVEEGGRTIRSLVLTDAGPGKVMRLDFGQRLTIVTGDNGLGKSFLLDTAWWAATGFWADREAHPHRKSERSVPTIEYELTSNSGRSARVKATFDRATYSWLRPGKAMTVEALGVFSRADGSFALNDPYRNRISRDLTSKSTLTQHEIWNGREGLIEGLLRDWIRWQSATDRKAFDQFSAVLRRLSPEDLGTLTPGPPVRLPGNPKEIPTISHRYDTVPVTHASAGVRRVLMLAYLIIWVWREHELAAEQLGKKPLRRILVIVDELEAHLHPKWQRIVLPALMSVGDLLSADIAVQMMAATHSPMVLASMESVFDQEEDALYHLFGDGPTVQLEEVPFAKYGDASGWLMSPLFGMRHARSREAEAAIEQAKALQLVAEPSRSEVRDVSQQLIKHLSPDDKFWSRWLYFAEQHGVDL